MSADTRSKAKCGSRGGDLDNEQKRQAEAQPREELDHVDLFGPGNVRRAAGLRRAAAAGLQSSRPLTRRARLWRNLFGTSVGQARNVIVPALCLERAQQLTERDLALAPHDEVDPAVRVLGVGLWSEAPIIAADDDARAGGAACGRDR